MDLNSFKALLMKIDEETKTAHQNYANQSAAHKVAIQIMQFEKELYYGDIAQARHIKKIKDIIEINAEDIVNEID
ncbi:CxC ATPase DNA modification system associated small protein [Aeromonas veronii]